MATGSPTGRRAGWRESAIRRCMFWRAGCRPGKRLGIRCFRAPTCRARPSPRSSRSTGTRRMSPPPNSTASGARGRRWSVLDSRTVEEFNRFHVPGAVTCPGAELVHRFGDLVPDPDTLVVVSCAGRTRSIIGAQSLINAGVPNKVVSLQGGTQAWRIAGLELERDTGRRSASVSKAAAEAARSLAEEVSRTVRRAADRSRDARNPGSARVTRGRPICSTCARRTNTRRGICRGRCRPRAASLCRRSTAGSAQRAPVSCWWTIPGRARS